MKWCLRLYFESLRRREVGVRTVGYVHATLRAALEDAVREELLDKNPAKLVRVPRPPKMEPEPLSVDEVRKLLRVSREHRLHALLTVFALPGLRRSEALGLRWEDIDLETGALQVRRRLQRVNGRLETMPTKTARSRRTVPLPSIQVDALIAHSERQEKERVDLAERNCTRVVQEACRRAGVRMVRLHDFRHGSASVLLGLGVPLRTAMEIVGHSTIEMTMNVYGHVSLDEKRQALEKVGNLFEEEK